MPLLALVFAFGGLLLAPETAAGGGWWSHIDLDRTLVTAGQRVELSATVSPAEAAQRPFRVYLLRGFDDSILERAMRRAAPGGWWSVGGAEAIEVGQVSVIVRGPGLARATAAFTVPELPPGTYHLMLCDTGCTEPLAEVIPRDDFTVVGDPATARLLERVGRLERRSRNQAAQLVTWRDVTDTALLAARGSRADVKRLEATVASRASPAPSPWAYAGWPVAGVLLLLALGRLGLRVFAGRRSGDEERVTATSPTPRPDQRGWGLGPVAERRRRR